MFTLANHDNQQANHDNQLMWLVGILTISFYKSFSLLDLNPYRRKFKTTTPGIDLQLY